MATPAAGAPSAGRVEVRRSARRRRTVSAYRDGDTTVVLVPAQLSRAEERRWVEVMLERLDRRDAARRRRSDDDLAERARRLAAAYLDGRARPARVRWVDNQDSRWGSCTPSSGEIRLSSRLVGRPDWVVDYVLLHELVHLLVPTHGPEFWALVGRMPRAERARGYLEGYGAGAAGGFSAGDGEGDGGLPGDVDGPVGGLPLRG